MLYLPEQLLTRSKPHARPVIRPYRTPTPAAGWRAASRRRRWLLQASQHALPLCPACLSELAPRIDAPSPRKFADFLNSHRESIISPDDLSANVLGCYEDRFG